MPSPFLNYNYDDVKELFGDPSARRTITAKSATAFFEGDHWQNTAGFIGQLPPSGLSGASQITAEIRDAFVTENVIQEVVETHVGGVLGREPLWSLLVEEGEKKEPDAETGDILTPWWNKREALRDLQTAASTLTLESIAVKRLFFPRGLVPETGELQPSDLSAALDFIYIQTLTADVAGVFTDPDTQKRVSIYLFDEIDDEGNVDDSCAELSFLDDEENTVVRVVRDKGKDDDPVTYKLGGQLFLFEMNRRALITEQVQSNQRALNLAHTMMMRNVNMAGARERTVSNAKPPTVPRRSGEQSERMEPGTYQTGPGAVMFLMGFPIRNDQDQIVGYTNPNVSISDPAPVDVFVKTRDHYYAAILGQCHQKHVLISGDATASGVSRKQAEKSYQRSLKESKTVLDAAGRWELETALRLAAQISNQTAKYINLRADFNCLLDIGEPDPDDRRVAKEMRDAGLISDETAMNWIGIDDAEAEKNRIEEEGKIRDQTALRSPLNARLPANTATPTIRSLFGAQPTNQPQ